MLISLYLILISLLSLLTTAQFPPVPEGVTTIRSQYHNGASLSYKQTLICETTPGVKAYSGYINLPSTLTNENFTISTFYWFFESRKSPASAPFSIYLAGGPGESSMDGVTGDGGPCNINADSNSTSLNPWSFNNEVNMLYIDQPVQTGFSYDTLVNGTFDLISGLVTPRNFSPGFPVNETTLWGTFPSQDLLKTTLGSERGASALWHFMQVWVVDFPKHNMKNKKISIWGNSWAGFYVSATFAFFERQNQQNRQNLEDAPAAQQTAGTVLPLGVMGTTNGCIDPQIEAPLYPEMATNNTYGFVAYNQSVYEVVLDALTQCKDLIKQCQSLAAIGDPDYDGKNETVNSACSTAFIDCYTNVQGPYTLSGRSSYDISHPALDPFPSYLAPSFFNQRHIQSALGVPLNFSWYGLAPEETYAQVVGDATRGNISNLDYVLQSGYRVAMVHGDRDYRWLGGEAVSLAANWTHASQFRKSGYAHIRTNASYAGGFVRQAGMFSFSRVFQGGHDVQAFQPETVARIFTRTMLGLDVATGEESVLPKKHSTDCEYSTSGPLTVRGVTEALPPTPEVECYIWNAESRCTPGQIEALLSGKAVVEEYLVVSPGPEEV